METGNKHKLPMHVDLMEILNKHKLVGHVDLMETGNKQKLAGHVYLMEKNCRWLGKVCENLHPCFTMNMYLSYYRIVMCSEQVGYTCQL